MSDQSTNLQLPFVASAQAQKHVTINETLLRLDALVQLSVMSATTTAQPASPSDGQLYILPAGKTGAAWGGMTNWALAYYRDGAWEQISPREGWIAFVKDTDALAYYTGAAWATLSASISFTATDRILGRVSSGGGASEEVSFTDQAQQLCDDTSFPAMLTTLGAVAKAGDAMSGNLEIAKSTPVFKLTDSAGPTSFSIFNLGGALYIERPAGGNAMVMTGSTVEFGAPTQPSSDNAYTLGSASRRWSTIYAATGSINTSDAREKTALRPLTDAERAAIRRIVAGIGIFQWRDAVSDKGAEYARLHVGVTAQAVQAAFAAEGLDASRYGLFCVDRDENDETRLSLRTDQLLLMALASDYFE